MKLRSIPRALNTVQFLVCILPLNKRLLYRIMCINCSPACDLRTVTSLGVYDWNVFYLIGNLRCQLPFLCNLKSNISSYLILCVYLYKYTVLGFRFSLSFTLFPSVTFFSFVSLLLPSFSPPLCLSLSLAICRQAKVRDLEEKCRTQSEQFNLLSKELEKFRLQTGKFDTLGSGTDPLTVCESPGSPNKSLSQLFNGLAAPTGKG